MGVTLLDERVGVQGATSAGVIGGNGPATPMSFCNVGMYFISDLGLGSWISIEYLEHFSLCKLRDVTETWKVLNIVESST